MCRSHTCWVFLDLGDFAISWVPVSNRSIDLFGCTVHRKILVGSTCNALHALSGVACRTTGCAICVLPILYHIRSAPLDLLPLQEMALLSPGESIIVSHWKCVKYQKCASSEFYLVHNLKHVGFSVLVYFKVSCSSHHKSCNRKLC